MTCFRLCLGISGASFLLAALPGVSYADGQKSEQEPVRLDFLAAEDCATSARFMLELQLRTSRFRTAEEDEPAHTFRVRIDRHANRATGELTDLERDGSTTSRSVEGRTCEEVVEALALIASLSAAAPSENKTPAAAPSAPKPLPSSVAENSIDPHELPPTDEQERNAEEETRSAIAKTRVTLGATVDGVAIHNNVLGGSAYVEVERDRKTWLAPSLRFAFTRYGTTLYPTPVTSASFLWTLGSMDVCPVRLKTSLGWRVALLAKPCAIIDAGALDASGTASIEIHRRGLWIAAGTNVRIVLRIAFFDVETQLGIRVPLIRETFVFSPGIDIFRAPAVVPVGGVGLGMTFP